MYRYCLIADELRIGKTEFDSVLIGDSNKKDIKGCGFIHFDHKNKLVYFYGYCPYYGSASLEEMISVKNNGYYSPTLQGYKWFYTGSHELGDLSNYTEIV
jgi:hypothetical protein